MLRIGSSSRLSCAVCGPQNSINTATELARRTADDSPHSRDLMAIYALYQQESGA